MNSDSLLSRIRELLSLHGISTCNRVGGVLLDTLLPAGDVDIAGSHEIYYWQLSYGNGLWITSKDSAVYICVRDDVGKVALCRPVGSPSGCRELIARALSLLKSCTDYEVWVRYCSTSLGSMLIDDGWLVMRAGWSDASPLDDEMYPQVVLDVRGIRLCKGTAYRNVRLARAHQDGRWDLVVEGEPRRGAFEFARMNPPRSVSSSEEFMAFTDATQDYIDLHGSIGLRFYHLYSSDGNLGAFGITSSGPNTLRRADGLYFSVRSERWLSPYFMLRIADDLADTGYVTINLGGSETSKLHRFKTRDFGPWTEVHTVALSR